MKSKNINLVRCLVCFCAAFGLIGRIWSLEGSEAESAAGKKVKVPSFELVCYSGENPVAPDPANTICAFEWLKKNDKELFDLYRHYCDVERTSDPLWCRFVIQLFDVDAMSEKCCPKQEEGDGAQLAIKTTPGPRSAATPAAGQNSSQVGQSSSAIARAKATVTPKPIS
jgi:hypothetical protein